MLQLSSSILNVAEQEPKVPLDGELIVEEQILIVRLFVGPLFAIRRARNGAKGI